MKKHHYLIHYCVESRDKIKQIHGRLLRTSSEPIKSINDIPKIEKEIAECNNISEDRVCVINTQLLGIEELEDKRDIILTEGL